VFRGRYEHALDGKGRTSLPSRFREVLTGLGDERLVMTTGFEKCVVVYPVREWNAFEERLLKLPQFDKAVVALRRLFFGNAVEVDVDQVGRLLVPQTLRNHADLKREAVWLGQGPTIELWDPQHYSAMREGILNDEQSREAIERRLAELNF
jgi:MraZ protein